MPDRIPTTPEDRMQDDKDAVTMLIEQQREDARDERQAFVTVAKYVCWTLGALGVASIIARIFGARP